MGDYGKNKGFQKKGTAIFERAYAAGTVAPSGIFEIANTTIFNDSESISIVSVTQIMCKAGKKYNIRAEIHVDGFSDYMLNRLYNVTTSQYIGVDGLLIPATSVNASGNTVIAEATITPNVDTVIEFHNRGVGTSGSYRTVIKVEEVEALLSETLGQTRFIEDVSFNGFTQLGESAPKIKMKKLTGTTPSTEGGTVSVVHGLTSSKIISFTGVIHIDSTTTIPLGYKPETSGNQGFEVYCYVSGSNFNIINHATNSENILSRPFTIIVWYEE